MLYTPENMQTLASIMEREQNAGLQRIGQEYLVAQTIGSDLPYVLASGKDEDKGEFEEPWEYNKTSNLTSLGEGTRAYRTGKYDREDTMGMRSTGTFFEQDQYEHGGAAAVADRTHQLDINAKNLGLDKEHDIFYGDKMKDTRSFVGLYARYNAITDMDGVLASDHSYVSPYITLSAKGTSSGHLHSAWLIVPGEHEVCMIYPGDAGYTAGLKYDEGKWTDILDTDVYGNRVTKTVLSDKVKAKSGLAIRNRKACVRIANIDLSTKESIDNFERALYDACSIIPQELASRVRIYIPRRAHSDYMMAYRDRFTPNTFEGAVPKNLFGSFSVGDNLFFRETSHLTVAEPLIQ